MAHIKSFGDLGGSGSDDEGPGDFNDYYAGGEKRCGVCGACVCAARVLRA